MKAQNCIQVLFRNCCFWKKQIQAPAPLTEVDIFRDYQFQNLENQTIREHKFRGESLRISSVTNCNFQILQNLGSVVVEAAQDSFLLLGPTKGKARFSDCKRLTVYLWTHQFQVQNCLNCKFYLHCEKTGEIIDSQNIITENIKISISRRILAMMVRAKLSPFRGIVNWETSVDQEDFTQHLNRLPFLKGGQLSFPVYSNIITKGSKFYYSKRTQDQEALLAQIVELGRAKKIQFFYECRVDLLSEWVKAIVVVVEGILNSPWFILPQSLQSQLRSQICDELDNTE